jgi:hypothetical protein
MSDSSPLRGRTIAVTRADQQLGATRQLFEAAGAAVVDLPALVIGPPDNWGPLDDALAEMESAFGSTTVAEMLAKGDDGAGGSSGVGDGGAGGGGAGSRASGVLQLTARLEIVTPPPHK